jgi:hypothetical protein
MKKRYTLNLSEEELKVLDFILYHVGGTPEKPHPRYFADRIWEKVGKLRGNSGADINDIIAEGSIYLELIANKE